MPVSADLGKPLENFVEELVKSGRYRSRSEVLREGIRLVQERERRLQALDIMIDAGLAAMEYGHVRSASEAFAGVRARLRSD